MRGPVGIPAPAARDRATAQRRLHPADASVPQPYDPPPMRGDLAVTANEEADRLLDTEPLALLLGILLDEQVR